MTYDHVVPLERYLSREQPYRRAVFRSSEHVSRARLRRLREGARLNGKSRDCSDRRAALPDVPCVRRTPSLVMPLRASRVYLTVTSLTAVRKRYPVPDFAGHLGLELLGNHADLRVVGVLDLLAFIFWAPGVPSASLSHLQKLLF